LQRIDAFLHALTRQGGLKNSYKQTRVVSSDASLLPTFLFLIFLDLSSDQLREKTILKAVKIETLKF